MLKLMETRVAECGSKLSCRLFIYRRRWWSIQRGKSAEEPTGCVCKRVFVVLGRCPTREGVGGVADPSFVCSGCRGTLDYSLCSRNVSWGFFSGFSLRLQETDSRRTAWIAQSDESVAYAIYMSFP